MSCLKPLVGYYSKVVNASGKRSLVFKKEEALSGLPVPVPCGKCIECRIANARAKAVRGEHELRMWSRTHDSSFVTLTYNDKSLPTCDGQFPTGNLVKRDLQLFMKRLRKRKGNGIRFIASGEYGTDKFRPHYHIIFFNVGFADKRKCGVGKHGDPIFQSNELDDLWSVDNNSLGRAVIGNVTFDSIMYVCQYVTKKLYGDYAYDYAGRLPEFGCSSQGIGKSFFEKYSTQLYRDDNCVVKGQEVSLPRYYDTKYELLDSGRLKVLKRRRRRLALLNKQDKGSRRSRVRELVTLAKLRLKGSQI